MTAFVVFTKEQTTDQAELDLYAQEVAASFPGHDVQFLATYGAFEVLEGGLMEGSVILEFPDMDAARAWYWSPAYQQAAKHRFNGATYRAFIVEGRSD